MVPHATAGLPGRCASPCGAGAEWPKPKTQASWASLSQGKPRRAPHVTTGPASASAVCQSHRLPAARHLGRVTFQCRRRYARNMSQARAAAAERNDIARTGGAFGVPRRVASATTALHAASLDDVLRRSKAPMPHSMLKRGHCELWSTRPQRACMLSRQSALPVSVGARSRQARARPGLGVSAATAPELARGPELTAAGGRSLRQCCSRRRRKRDGMLRRARGARARAPRKCRSDGAVVAPAFASALGSITLSLRSLQC